MNFSTANLNDFLVQKYDTENETFRDVTCDFEDLTDFEINADLGTFFRTETDVILKYFNSTFGEADTFRLSEYDKYFESKT